MSALPQLKLDVDPEDSAHLRLVFEPPPDVWQFDPARGTRELLREQLQAQVQLFLEKADPTARFDDHAQSTLQAGVRMLLLQWIGFRGLHVPAGR